MPSGGPFYAAAKPAVLDRLEASIFLHDVVPPRMLHSLKFLEIAFPPADSGYISLGSSAYEDWVENISYVEDKLNLPRLTLRIYFHGFRSSSDAMPYRRSELTREEDMQTIVSMCELIASPLSQLGNRLDRCIVHAAWPWAWGPEEFYTMRNNMQEVERDQLQTERSFKKHIMGDDSYGSRSMGKMSQSTVNGSKCMWNLHEYTGSVRVVSVNGRSMHVQSSQYVLKSINLCK